MPQAAVSISLRGASALATDTAQVVLMNQDIAQLATLFDLAHALQANMKYTLSAVVVPSLYSMGGVLFLGFGLAQAFTLTLLGMAAGVVVAVSPLLWQRRPAPAPAVSLPAPSVKKTWANGALESEERIDSDLVEVDPAAPVAPANLIYLPLVNK